MSKFCYQVLAHQSTSTISRSATAGAAWGVADAVVCGISPAVSVQANVFALGLTLFTPLCVAVAAPCVMFVVLLMQLCAALAPRAAPAGVALSSAAGATPPDAFLCPINQSVMVDPVIVVETGVDVLRLVALCSDCAVLRVAIQKRLCGTPTTVTVVETGVHLLPLVAVHLQRARV